MLQEWEGIGHYILSTAVRVDQTSFNRGQNRTEFLKVVIVKVRILSGEDGICQNLFERRCYWSKFF